MMRNLWEVYNKFRDYDYEDMGTDREYHIKTPDEFEEVRGGVCWDFVGPMALELAKQGVPWKCYYTGIHKGHRTLATHTYIIAERHQWIECSWQKHKGIHHVDSFRDVVRLLLNTYQGSVGHTVIYNPLRTFGMSTDEFFEYLEEEGRYLCAIYP